MPEGTCPMDDVEIALSLPEIVAILLPLTIVVLGFVVRWLRTEDDLFPERPAVSFAVFSGLALMLLALTGIILLIVTIREAQDWNLRTSIITLGFVFLFLAISGLRVSALFAERYDATAEDIGGTDPNEES